MDTANVDTVGSYVPAYHPTKQKLRGRPVVPLEFDKCGFQVPRTPYSARQLFIPHSMLFIDILLVGLCKYSCSS
jgi:hypothetical protein